ncbi:MAG: chloride channel protein [Neisseria sp.]|nr:chloride channel protein [Neisseria sp.]
MDKRNKLWLALALIGIIGGVVGIVLTRLMHFVQHHAFRYALHGEALSFREGVEAAPPALRVSVLVLCGVLAGSGWWLLNRYGRELTDAKQALERPLEGLPFWKTLAHSALQIITVGMGSPLGREVAPREAAAAFATVCARKIGLDEQGARLLTACAAGAGLAAGYNVPLASTLFVLEAMLGVWTRQAVAAALLTTVLATAVAWAGLGDFRQYIPSYTVSQFEINHTLLYWSVAAGPLLGAAAAAFRRSIRPLPLVARGGGYAVWAAAAAFALIGLLSIRYPDILGNGKAGNQLVFGGMIGWTDSLELFAAKWLAIILALAAGAYGGLITPSMMLGSTLAYAAAMLWNMFLPAAPEESAAVVGAAVFLGLSLNMPLTALVFILDLTRAPISLLMPLCACMAGAVMTAEWLENQAARRGGENNMQGTPRV